MLDNKDFQSFRPIGYCLPWILKKNSKIPDFLLDMNRNALHNHLQIDDKKNRRRDASDGIVSLGAGGSSS